MNIITVINLNENIKFYELKYSNHKKKHNYLNQHNYVFIN